MVPPAAEAQRGFVRGDFFFLGLEKKTRSFKSDLYPYRLAKENASFTSPGLNFSPSVKWENNGSLAEPL